MEDRYDVCRRQTGVIVILAAGLTWAAFAIIAMANQISFFSMTEYLRSPMWTSQVPSSIKVPLTVSAIVMRLSSLLLLFAAMCGTVLLFSRIKTRVTFAVVSWLFVGVGANLLIYECLTTVGYAIARDRLPERYGESLQVFAIAESLVIAAAFVVRWSGGRLSRVGAPASSLPLETSNEH
jgi:hypothetical protein